MSDEVERKPIFRKKVVPLTGEWVGWSITALTKASMRTVQEFVTMREGESVDLDKATALLERVIVDWDFEDENGVPLPKPSAEYMKELPLDLVAEIMRVYVESVTQNPPA